MSTVSLLPTATGEVPYEPPRTRPTLVSVRPDDGCVSPRPEPDLAAVALDYLADLVEDPRTGLTHAQRAAARVELDALTHDGFIDAIREDPTAPASEVPGRAIVSALRVLVARGLLREEWDT